VNAEGVGGQTPLMEAADEPGVSFDQEHAEVARLLLAARASVNTSDSDGWTAPHHGTRWAEGCGYSVGSRSQRKR
jgi:ankyrin repeat protein